MILSLAKAGVQGGAYSTSLSCASPRGLDGEIEIAPSNAPRGSTVTNRTLSAQVLCLLLLELLLSGLTTTSLREIEWAKAG